MTTLTQTDRPLSLAERAVAALGKSLPSTEKSCLLLDVSGSMDDPAEPGVRKITALRSVVAGLSAPAIFAFSRRCRRVTRETIPNPDGGTALHIALAHVRARGMTRVVLVTDGLPDDEQAALDQARGLALEICYVGPAPQPEFLSRLAAAARAGSSATQCSLASGDRAKLAQRMTLLLTDGR